MPAQVKVPTTFTATDKFSAVVTKMTRGIKKWSKVGINAVSRFDRKITKSFKKLGNLSQVALGIGIGTIFRSGTMAVTDYETGLIAVSKTTGIAGKELKDFGADVVNTSRSLRGVSSLKLLELSQTAGQLGITGSKNILKFATTMAKLETASNVVGQEGAAAVARILNITGEGPGVVDKFSASLVFLGNNVAATEKEILSAASEISRSTAAYKITSDQILGISAAMKSLDIRPEAAGTAVGKVFRGIELATIEGGKNLRNFGKVMGVSSNEVIRTFKKDPAQAFQLFIKGLNRINKQGGSVAKILKDLGLTGEILKKGITPLSTRYDLLASAIEGSTNSFIRSNGNLKNSVDKEFSTATRTINTALSDMKNNFHNVLIATTTSGDGLDWLREIMFALSDNMNLVVSIGATLIAGYVLMKTIVVATTIATGAYSIALGVMGAMSGKASIAISGNTIALNAYKIALALSSAATWVATAATTAFGIALNLSIWPITLIVAGIAAIIAIIMNWSKITAWFGKIWKKFTGWISGLWGNVVKWFKNFDFKAFFMNIGKSIIKFLLFPLKAVLFLISKIPGKIGKLAKAGLDKIGNLEGKFDVTHKRSTEKGEALTKLKSPEQRTSEIIKTSETRNNLSIDIKDPGNNVSSVKMDDTDDVPIKLSSTQAAY